MAPAIFQVRRGTTAQWVSPTQGPLRAGEIGQDTTTKAVKIGDGTTAFASLPFWPAGTAAFGPTVLTAATTLTTAQETVVCDPTSGPFTVTLPTAVGATGKVYTIKKLASAIDVTLAATGAQTIDGVSTFLLDLPYAVVTVVSDGTNWVVRSEAKVPILDATTSAKGIVQLSTPEVLAAGTSTTQVPSVAELKLWADLRYASKTASVEKVLTADVSATATTALALIGDLAHTLVANEKWYVDGVIHYVTTTSSGLKLSLLPPGTVLEGTRLYGSMMGIDFGPTGAAGVLANQVLKSQPIRFTTDISQNVRNYGGTGAAITAANLHSVSIQNVRVTPGIGGELRLRFAQSFATTPADVTTILAGSYLVFVRAA